MIEAAFYILIALTSTAVGIVLAMLALYPRVKHDEDVSGITQNPPQFIDVLAKKTLNIKIDDKYDIKIPHLPFLETIYGIREIQGAYTALQNACGDEVRVDEKTLPMFLVFSETLTNYLFSISKKFVEKRNQKKYKAALRKKILSDIEWTQNVTTELYDFWALIKKKAEMLASGTTIRQMYGVDATPDYLKTDWQGNTSLQPRFGNALNTTAN